MSRPSRKVLGRGWGRGGWGGSFLFSFRFFLLLYFGRFVSPFSVLVVCVVGVSSMWGLNFDICFEGVFYLQIIIIKQWWIWEQFRDAWVCLMFYFCRVFGLFAGWFACVVHGSFFLF